ncbi:MAG: 50S ribosomal protein L35 [bacterium]|nr:50S ribosomal protein L35 [bacterium]
MPKIRTNRGAHKRFRASATGKIKRKRAYHSHILTKKSPKRKRILRSSDVVSSADQKSIRRLLPYM